MTENHSIMSRTYIEPTRLVEESNCKYYKRIIVGLVNYINDNRISLDVPEEYFSDVPDNVGFEDSINMSDTITRRIQIIEDWNTGTDDCGGTEISMNNLEFAIEDGSVVYRENKTLHLKVVK